MLPCSSKTGMLKIWMLGGKWLGGWQNGSMRSEKSETRWKVSGMLAEKGMKWQAVGASG